MTDEEILKLIERQMQLEEIRRSMDYAQDSPEIRLSAMKIEKELYEIREVIRHALK